MRAFITATGTDIGKTFVTCALVHQLKASGRSVRAVKPVMSGFSEDDLLASDAGQLLVAQAKEVTLPSINDISPYRYTAPLSPHNAAEIDNRQLPYASLIDWCKTQLSSSESHVFIEGVGGVAVPLDWHHTSIEWMQALSIPAILVCGNYLGTISHTLSAAYMLKTSGISIHALVINDMNNGGVALSDTEKTLRHFLPDIRHIISLPRASHWQDAKNMLEIVL